MSADLQCEISAIASDMTSEISRKNYTKSEFSNMPPPAPLQSTSVISPVIEKLGVSISSANRTSTSASKRASIFDEHLQRIATLNFPGTPKSSLAPLTSSSEDSARIGGSGISQSPSDPVTSKDVNSAIKSAASTSKLRKSDLSGSHVSGPTKFLEPKNSNGPLRRFADNASSTFSPPTAIEPPMVALRIRQPATGDTKPASGTKPPLDSTTKTGIRSDNESIPAEYWTKNFQRESTKAAIDARIIELEEYYKNDPNVRVLRPGSTVKRSNPAEVESDQEAINRIVPALKAASIAYDYDPTASGLYSAEEVATMKRNYSSHTTMSREHLFGAKLPSQSGSVGGSPGPYLSRSADGSHSLSTKSSSARPVPPDRMNSSHSNFLRTRRSAARPLASVSGVGPVPRPRTVPAALLPGALKPPSAEGPNNPLSPLAAQPTGAFDINSTVKTARSNLYEPILQLMIQKCNRIETTLYVPSWDPRHRPSITLLNSENVKMTVSVLIEKGGAGATPVDEVAHSAAAAEKVGARKSATREEKVVSEAQLNEKGRVDGKGIVENYAQGMHHGLVAIAVKIRQSSFIGALYAILFILVAFAWYIRQLEKERVV